MSELAPLLRIFLYILGTWLAARGVPPEIANLIGNDPAMIELAAQALGPIIAALAFVWYRVAKRFGWAT